MVLCFVSFCLYYFLCFITFYFYLVDAVIVSGFFFGDCWGGVHGSDIALFLGDLGNGLAR